MSCMAPSPLAPSHLFVLGPWALCPCERSFEDAGKLEENRVLEVHMGMDVSPPDLAAAAATT